MTLPRTSPNVFALGPRRGWLLAAVIYTGAVAIDCLTPPELSVFPLYLFATLIVSWNSGRRSGFVFASLCLLTVIGLSVLEGTGSLEADLFRAYES